MNLQKLALSLTLGGMIAGAGCTSLEGESELTIGGTSSNAVSHNPSDSDDLINALARIEMAEAETVSARAEAVAARAALYTASQGAESGSNQLFPANAVPGHCYARVLLPATFIEQSDQVLVKAESTRIEVTQPEYEWVTEQKLSRQASSRIEVIPAEYKTITEQVIVKPESTRLVSVPAQYEQVTEQILDKPAHTEWKRGRLHADRADVAQAGAGEVVRMVEIPATYKTVTRSVQVTPASVQEVVEPAEFKSVAKTVVVTPATTREVTVPAQYTTVRSLNMVKAGETREVTVPAEFQTLTRRVKVSDESLEWREVVCDADLTITFVSEVQRSLHQEGYFDSPVDGIYQRLTQKGINRFAKNNDLPFGSDFMTLEVANALGLDN